MKTVKILLLLVITIAAFNSCKKDKNYETPRISWEGESFQVLDFTSSDNVSFTHNIIFEAEAGIKKITITEIQYDPDNNIISSTLQTEPSNYSGKTVFRYDFIKTYLESDFDNKSKFELKFEITDNEDRVESKIFTLTRRERSIEPQKYLVSFIVKNDENEQITNATITLNGVTNVEDDYQFYDMAPGTYNYLVTKIGYSQAGGSITVVDSDIQVTAVINYIGVEVK